MVNQPRNSHIFALLPTLEDYNHYRTALGRLHLAGLESTDADFINSLRVLLHDEFYPGASPPAPASTPFPFTVKQLRSVAPAITREVQRRREEKEEDCSREAAWIALRHVRAERPTERRPMRARRARRLNPLRRQREEQRGEFASLSSSLPQYISQSVSASSSPPVLPSSQSSHGYQSSVPRQVDSPRDPVARVTAQVGDISHRNDASAAIVSQLALSRHRLRAVGGVDPMAAIYMTSTDASLAGVIEDAERVIAALKNLLRNATQARESAKEADVLFSQHDQCSIATPFTWPLFPPSAHFLSLPDWLNDVIPSHQSVKVDGDGRCWLRCICIGVEPDREVTEQRLECVRCQLYDELCRWGPHRWMQHVPLYSVRDMLVGDMEASESRTSYDVYKEYLSLPTYSHKHLDHAVFYLASKLFNVEFIIVARLQGTSNHPRIYHRRINEAVRPRCTIVVAHYSEHYELINVCTDDALSRLLQLPLLTPWGKVRDMDYERLQRQTVKKEENNEVMVDDEQQDMIKGVGEAVSSVQSAQPVDKQRVIDHHPSPSQAGNGDQAALKSESERRKRAEDRTAPQQQHKQLFVEEHAGSEEQYEKCTPKRTRRSRRLLSAVDEGSREAIKGEDGRLD